MELREALWALEEGYCLWVGAGVTKQLAANATTVPLWEQLTHELEITARLPNDDTKDLPSRLDRCMTVLGAHAFRGLLRERYYTSLCAALLSQADAAAHADTIVPEHVRAIAALGQLANPIVSFNIEPLSSILLARPAGPIRIVAQQEPGKPAYDWREPAGRFHRLIYHPHGIATADTVMTATQYAANRQTLAFGLAIHAAFGNRLMIVGMSLDDDYLREHIERFRTSLAAVYWFNNEFSAERSAWAATHRITMVSVDWTEFWQRWCELPVELDSTALASAWYLAVLFATEEAEGGSLGSLRRSLNALKGNTNSAGFVALAEQLAHAGVVAGEPGTMRLIEGKEPRAIELALRDRMIRDQIPMPLIATTYSPEGAP